MWNAPADDERRSLLAEHAHRFPVPCRIPVRGDHGTPVNLTFLLGNPTGALRAPPGAVSPAFAQIIGAVTLGKTDEGDDDELVRDCVLWPDPRQLAAARGRWPGIVAELSKQIARKIGLSESPTDVRRGEDLPASIDEALAGHPSAVVRRLMLPSDRPKPERVLVAIDTPDRLRYDAFSDAINERGADRVKLVREFADGMILAVDGMAPGALCDRWPGAMLLCVGVALKLAGSAGAAAMGEW